MLRSLGEGTSYSLRGGSQLRHQIGLIWTTKAIICQKSSWTIAIEQCNNNLKWSGGKSKVVVFYYRLQIGIEEQFEADDNNSDEIGSESKEGRSSSSAREGEEEK